MRTKIFRFCVFASVALVVGCLGYGAFQKELLGYLFWGFLIAAVFVNIAVIVSIFCDKGAIQLARLLWVGFCIAILATGFSIVHPADNPDAGHEMGKIIGFPMSILTMPLGVVGTVLTSKFQFLRPNHFYMGNSFDWLIFFVWGYIQWFLLYPWLVNGIRKRLSLKQAK